MELRSDLETRHELSSKLRWLAIFFQSALLFPAVKLGYVLPESIPFYLSILFLILISNVKTVRQLFPKNKALLIHLCLDLISFCGLIYLSGKMENPFWPLIYLHAGLGAILLNPKEEYIFLPILFISTFLIHYSSYAFHSSLFYVIIPQWVILITTWTLTRALGLTVLKQREKLTRLERKDQKIQKLKSIGSLSAGILHELSTPLNTLRIKADKLQSSKESFNDKDYEYLEKALIQCENIVSNLNTAQQEMALKLTRKENLTSFIKAKADEYNQKNESISINVNVDAETECLFAKVNLSLILDTIIENAKEVEVSEINFEIIHQESAIFLNIQDNGPGFDRFILENFGAPYTTTKGRGRGLGLFTAMMSLESIGGELSISNNKIGALITMKFLKD